MKQTAENDQIIIRYLLNELSEEDQACFEEAYLGSSGFFEQVQALEEELIEDYVQGNLSSHERQRFEDHYLASEQRRARIENTRELVQVCSLRSSVQAAANDTIDGKFFPIRLLLRLLAKQHLALGFGVVAVLLLLLESGLVIEWLRLRGRLTELSREKAALEQQAGESERRLAYGHGQLTEERKWSIALREEVENLNRRLDRMEGGQDTSQAAKNQVVSLVLGAGIRDIGEPDRAVISTQTSFVDLRVNLNKQEATNFHTYRGVVKAVEGGKEIWTQERIKLQQSKSAQYVVIRVPVNRFKAAGRRDFMLTLCALAAGRKDHEELKKSYFQVIVR